MILPSAWPKFCAHPVLTVYVIMKQTDGVRDNIYKIYTKNKWTYNVKHLPNELGYIRRSLLSNNEGHTTTLVDKA